MASKKTDQNSSKCRLCVLPDNNFEHLATGVYLLFSVILMVARSQLVTCFSILLFVTPQIIVLMSLKLKIHWINAVRVGALILSVSTVIFCMFEWAGVLTDQGNYYMIVNTSRLLPCCQIPKDIVVYSLFIQPAISFMFFFGIPTKRSVALISERKSAINKQINNPTEGLTESN